MFATFREVFALFQSSLNPLHITFFSSQIIKYILKFHLFTSLLWFDVWDQQQQQQDGGAAPRAQCPPPVASTHPDWRSFFYDILVTGRSVGGILSDV